MATGHGKSRPDRKELSTLSRSVYSIRADFSRGRRLAACANDGFDRLHGLAPVGGPCGCAGEVSDLRVEYSLTSDEDGDVLVAP